MFGWLRSKKLTREIIVNAETLETRVAIVENGELEEYQVEHRTEERIVGSIFKGRIQNLEHDLQAAFVDIGLKKNAFLHYWDMFPDCAPVADVDEGAVRRQHGRRRSFTNADIEKRFPAGSEIVVQVVKAAIGTKGPRVTAGVSVPSRFLVFMPGSGLRGVSKKIEDIKERQRLRKLLDSLPVPSNFGAIVRTAASGVRRQGLFDETRMLLGIWERIQSNLREHPAPCCIYEEPDLVERVVRDWLTEEVDRINVDSPEEYQRLKSFSANFGIRARSKVHLYEGELPIFEHYKVEQQLDYAFRREVPLESGGRIVIDETEALTAIDVNSGRHKGEGSQEEAILKINLEAVDEIARQIRLRNVGGLVVMDCIDMKSRKNQNAVYRAMKTALRRDRARSNLLPISELGLMEMTRQRAEESIVSATHVECPYCRGRGTVMSTLQMSIHIQRRIAAILRKGRKREPRPALQVIVNPAVLDRLRREDEQFLLDLETKHGAKLGFKSDPARHIEVFSILDASTGETLFSNEERRTG